MNSRTHACPRCKRTLAQSGELTVHTDAGDFVAPVFQCDECLVTVDFADGRIEVAYTFAVDQSGNVFDPAD